MTENYQQVNLLMPVNGRHLLALADKQNNVFKINLKHCDTYTYTYICLISSDIKQTW